MFSVCPHLWGGGVPQPGPVRGEGIPAMSKWGEAYPNQVQLGEGVYSSQAQLGGTPARSSKGSPRSHQARSGWGLSGAPQAGGTSQPGQDGGYPGYQPPWPGQDRDTPGEVPPTGLDGGTWGYPGHHHPPSQVRMGGTPGGGKLPGIPPSQVRIQKTRFKRDVQLFLIIWFSEISEFWLLSTIRFNKYWLRMSKFWVWFVQYW